MVKIVNLRRMKSTKTVKCSEERATKNLSKDTRKSIRDYITRKTKRKTMVIQGSTLFSTKTLNTLVIYSWVLPKVRGLLWLLIRGRAGSTSNLAIMINTVTSIVTRKKTSHRNFLSIIERKSSEITQIPIMV